MNEPINPKKAWTLREYLAGTDLREKKASAWLSASFLRAGEVRGGYKGEWRRLNWEATTLAREQFGVPLSFYNGKSEREVDK